MRREALNEEIGDKQARSKALTKSFVFAASCLLILGAFFCTEFHRQYEPRFLSGTFFENGKASKPLKLPFHLGKANRNSRVVEVSVELLFSSKIPELYDVVVLGHLEHLAVNGRKVRIGPFPKTVMRRQARTQAVDLSGFVRPGKNLIQARVRQQGERLKFDIQASRDDSLAAPMRWLFYSMLLLFFSLLWSAISNNKFPILTCIFVLGVFLRILYHEATPINERNHDMWAHLQYVKHVSEHFEIPVANACPVCFHPPLYYFLTGSWVRFLGDEGARDWVLYRELRNISLVLTVLTLLVGFRIGELLFENTKDTPRLLCFGALVSVFPALFYAGMAINNDALLIFLSFLLFYELLLWWKSGAKKHLVMAVFIMGLGLLTKQNMLALAPVALILVALRPGMPWRSKAGIVIASTFALVILVKAIVPRQPLVPVNQQAIGVSRRLAVSSTPRNLMVFNPVGVFETVYNSPLWDEYRRQYFWEYLFRSALFGEYRFREQGEKLRWISTQMVSIAMLLLIIVFIAVFSGLSRKRIFDELPLWSCLLSCLVAIFIFRLMRPASCVQDFRYIPIASVPLAYYAAKGIPHGWRKLRTLGVFITWVFVFFSALFFVRLWMLG